jgi:3-hydroxy-9,10-secoandrosta-1,3,5(10)-triene-9,17-dione monooxygenase reductase component
MSAIDSAHFRQVLGHFPTGVTVITATGSEGKPAGFAVGSFFSVSLAPALVGFAAGKGSSSWPGIRQAGSFCVNILAEDQEAVCRQFSSKAEDKFAGLGWQPASSGAPRLADVLAWIDCDIEAVHDAGDHEICIGRVRELAVERENGPLLFYRGGYGRFAI